MTIKELREKYHLSQSALAKSIGVSSSAISNMESGRMKASAKIADAVKNVYGEVIDVVEEKAENTREKAVIAAIETKAIADEVKVEATEKAMEIASSVKEKKAKVVKKTGAAKEKVQKAEKAVKATKKKVETRTTEMKDAAQKAEAKIESAKSQKKKVKDKIATTGKESRKATEKTADVGKKVINYAEVAMKKLMTQMRGFVVQSPLGGEITPDMIYEKVGDVDRVYIRVDQNKAYWVKGEETGSIDLW